MTKKKTNKVAAAAAAAAAAAVNASQESETGKVLFFSGSPDDDDDDDDHEEMKDAILEGLAQLDESVAGEIIYWELYCDSPLDKAGKIRRLGTSELKGISDECAGFGPGEYHVIARNKRGGFVKGTRQRIKISDFARPKAGLAAPSSSSDPVTIMAQMEERLEKRRLAARAERNSEIKFWAPILAPVGLELVRGLFGHRGGESLKDLVGALVSMRELSGGDGGSEKAVGLLLKGIELARDLEPGSAKGSTWPDALVNGVATIAKEFRPLAESMAARKTNGQAAPAGQLQFQTAPAGQASLPAGPSDAAQQSTETPQDNSMLAMVEPLLRKLAGELEDFAVNGADTGLAAEAMLAKIPRTYKAMVPTDQLKQWLTQPDWWDITVKFHPPLQPYQGFCDDVRLSILEQLEPQPDEGEST